MSDLNENSVNHQSGVLVCEQIKNLGIISKYATDVCFKPASYDLRLANEYLLPEYPENTETSKKLPGKPIVIPAFSSVIVGTHEILSLPNNVIGKFNLKIKMAMRGLFVQMGTQVEPGYTGRLFALLQNISDQEICLNTGDNKAAIFTIEFYFTSQAVPDHEIDKHSYNDLGGLLNKRDFVTGTIDKVTDNLQSIVHTQKTSIDELNKSIQNIEKKYDERENKILELESEVKTAAAKIFSFKNTAWGLAYSAVLILIISVFAPWLITSFTQTDEKISLIGTKHEYLDDSLDSQKESIDTSTREINELKKRLSNLTSIIDDIQKNSLPNVKPEDIQ